MIQRPENTFVNTREPTAGGNITKQEVSLLERHLQKGFAFFKTRILVGTARFLCMTPITNAVYEYAETGVKF